MQDRPTCRQTFTGNAQTRQHWFEAVSKSVISEAEARRLQLEQGFDPASFGLTNFHCVHRGDGYVARWACSSLASSA